MEINFFMNGGINPSFNNGIKPLQQQEVKEAKEAPKAKSEDSGIGKAIGSFWTPLANFMEANVDDISAGLSSADIKQNSNPSLGKKLDVYM